MKREFLSNIKIGDQALSKETIDLIMAENGKDIEAEKAKFADYDTVKTQLSEAQTTIQKMKDSGQTLEDVQKKATEWEEKYKQAIADHEAEKVERAFNDKLNTAITGAKGKNSKAIMALLDMDSLKASKNQDADIKAAIEACQKENDYLFGKQTPPRYSAGAGSKDRMNEDPGEDDPGSFADALHAQLFGE